MDLIFKQNFEFFSHIVVQSMFDSKRTHDVIYAVTLVDEYLLAVTLAQVDVDLDKWTIRLNLTQVELLLAVLSIFNLWMNGGILHIVVSFTLSEIQEIGIILLSVLFIIPITLPIHRNNAVVMDYILLIAFSNFPLSLLLIEKLYPRKRIQCFFWILTLWLESRLFKFFLKLWFLNLFALQILFLFIQD